MTGVALGVEQHQLREQIIPEGIAQRANL